MRPRRRRRPTQSRVHSTRIAVPTSGIVPTMPGVLAGSTPTAPVAPRGSVPGWLTGAPSIGDLGWSDAPTAAPAGDEANYYFLSVR